MRAEFRPFLALVFAGRGHGWTLADPTGNIATIWISGWSEQSLLPGQDRKNARPSVHRGFVHCGSARAHERSDEDRVGLAWQIEGRGFKFVGSTICYAFMQATGMVNDHVVDCFRYAELAALQLGR